MAAPARPHRKSRISRRLVALLAVVFIAIAAFLILSPGRKPVATVATVAVRRGDIVGTVDGSGTVTPERSVDLTFQATGVVTQVFVSEGETVAAGQPLARLDDRSLQSTVENDRAAVTSAQAGYASAVADAASGDSTLASLKASLDKATVSLQQAQSAYDKVAWLSNAGATSQAADLQNASIDFQKAKADFEAQATKSGPDSQSKIASAAATLTQAQETLKQAQIDLDNATLRAPFGGIITQIDVVPGSSTTQDPIAMHLIDRTPLHVDLKLSENDVVKVAVAQPVTLTADSLGDWTAAGTVSYVAAAAQTNNGVVTFVARVQFADVDPRVKVGMTANLSIVTARKQGVLLVPNSALLPKGSGHVVQVLGANGKPTDVDVQTGITNGTDTEVVGGLTEGMQIVAVPAPANAQPANPFAG